MGRRTFYSYPCFGKSIYSNWVNRRKHIMANDLTRKSCRNLTKTILFNKDKIYSLYWDKKMSMKDIAKTFSCSRQLINKFSKELKINGISTSSRMTKSRHPRWKNGRSPSHKNGKIINMGNGKQKFEHVLIIEKILG